MVQAGIAAAALAIRRGVMSSSSSVPSRSVDVGEECSICEILLQEIADASVIELSDEEGVKLPRKIIETSDSSSEPPDSEDEAEFSFDRSHLLEFRDLTETKRRRIDYVGLGNRSKRLPARTLESTDTSGPRCKLTSESESDLEEGCSRGPNHWVVGANTGRWIQGRWAPAAEQAQVLIANACTTVRRFGLQRDILGNRKTQKNLLYDSVARLLGLPPALVMRVYEKLELHEWMPAAVRCPTRRACATRRCNIRDAGSDRKIMISLIREVWE